MRTTVKTLFELSIVVLILIACKADDESPGLAQLSTVGASEITSNEVKSGGNVTSDGGAPVSSRGVVWSKEEAPSLETHLGLTIDGHGPGIFQSTISGLDKGQSYYIRAYGTNAAGTAYGQQIELSTFTDLPSVKTLDVENISSTGALGGGEVIDEGNAPVNA